MAHHIEVGEEHYEFKSRTKNILFSLLGAGVLIFVIGLFSAINDKGHEAEHHGAAKSESKLVASTQQHEAADAGDKHAEKHEASGGEHHETPTWLKRLYTTLWQNNLYFTGLGIIGLFFIAIQYAAQAGWSAGILRIPLAMGAWIPIAGLIMLALWFVSNHDIFHWTHSYLYDKGGDHFDKLINKKAPFFYWPLAGGTFPIFFIGRMVLFFGLWWFFWTKIRKNMLDEDVDPSTAYWYKNRVVATIFLIFFGVSSSIAAWDWAMSIDTHWFSTMFGWYMFASWWVTGLATIALIVAYLKSAGYLKVVNANHLHDIGKFCFAFSIFWTYIWFGQFLLIYYANIPEETVYFIQRMRIAPYNWIFYANLILNFVLPFLLFMTRDAKRQVSMLKFVCPIIIIGHWLDFFNIVTPGVMHENGVVGLLEIGTGIIFLAVYLLVVLTSLSKVPLVGRNHPMLQESLHHHI